MVTVAIVGFSVNVRLHGGIIPSIWTIIQVEGNMQIVQVTTDGGGPLFYNKIINDGPSYILQELYQMQIILHS